MNQEITNYLSTIGKKGGSKKGESKLRGDSDYYKSLAAKRKKGVRKSRKKKAVDIATGLR